MSDLQKYITEAEKEVQELGNPPELVARIEEMKRAEQMRKEVAKWFNKMGIILGIVWVIVVFFTAILMSL